MSEEKKSGSLGFFSSYDDLSNSSDGSDSDDDGGLVKKTAPSTAPVESGAQSSQQATKRAAGGAPLPRPDDLFRSVSKPAFLYNPLNKEIDWDNLTVKPPEEVNKNRLTPAGTISKIHKISSILGMFRSWFLIVRISSLQFLSFINTSIALLLERGCCWKGWYQDQ